MISLKQKKCIGIITLPIHDAGTIPLTNLINVLREISDMVYIIAGNSHNKITIDSNVKILYGKNHSFKDSLPLRILLYINYQILCSWFILKHRREIFIWIFFIGGQNMIIPVFTGILLRRKIIIMMGSSSFHTVAYKKNVLLHIEKRLALVNLYFSDKIVIYSKVFIEKWELTKFVNKIIIGSPHTISFKRFRIFRDIQQRDNVIGFVGRFTEEKGIINLIHSIALIQKKRKDLRFLLIGDGPKKDELHKFIFDNNLEKAITIIKWVSHDSLPDYLNSIKLLILPSYTEGLPNIMLEAMACGTPVLATPVGAIPDVIRDSETGFIMEDNSPECIARNVMRAMSDPDLERVAERGRMYVEEEYRFGKILEKWKCVLSTVD